MGADWFSIRDLKRGMAFASVTGMCALLFIAAMANDSSATSQCRSSSTNGSQTVGMSTVVVQNQTNANGSAVVLQAIGILQQTSVFGNDNGILRRIAYVETRDGTRPDSESNGGGIWAVNATKFLQTQNIEANARLPPKLQQIKDALNIDWLLVEWEDLQIPLYSAIAARLILYIAPRAIPPEDDLEAQARFWVENYSPDGDEDNFVGASSGLQGICIIINMHLCLLPHHPV